MVNQSETCETSEYVDVRKLVRTFGVKSLKMHYSGDIVPVKKLW